MQRTLTIGDVHGCLRALDALLAIVQPTPEDTLITLGDYIDRGPNSAGVLSRLIELHSALQVVSLRGNHEEILLDARKDAALFDLWLRAGGDKAIASYHGDLSSFDLSIIPQAHWDFLTNTCLDLWETDTHIFVHGGLRHHLPPAQQDASLLRWYCFDQQAPHYSGKVVVCGHMPQQNGLPRNRGHAICIDTNAWAGGWLTCYDVESRRCWQANEFGETRSFDL